VGGFKVRWSVLEMSKMSKRLK